jgi:MFS family permease
LTPELACYLAIGEGLCSSASWAAWQSLLRDLVDADEVLAAVSLSSAQFNLGRIIGPVLASVALAVGSPGPLLRLMNAASFIFVVVIFSFVRCALRPKPTTTMRLWGETVAGARRAWGVKGCRYPILAIATVGVIASPFIALVPAMAIEVLHAGQTGTALLVGAQGVGAVTGAVTLPALAKRTSRVFVLRASLATLVVAEVLYGLSPNLTCAALALAVLGGAYLGTLTGLNTSVQIHAPVRERARILALYTLSLSLSYPLGTLVQSAFAKTWGVRPVTIVAAGLVAVVLLAVSWARPQFWGEMGSVPAETTKLNLLAD